MHLEIRQRLRLEQRLVMSPRLQQAIKLLQLSHVDLVETVQQELVENPTLEEIPGTSSQEISGDEKRVREQASAERVDQVEQNNGKETSETDWQEVLDGYGSSAFKRGSGGSRYEDLPPIESTLKASDTLAQHLLWQLQMQFCTEAERRAARCIVLNLDERGFLSIPLEQVAADAGVELDDAEGAAMIVQSLDPMGCGSSGLAACLEVQARARFPEDPYIVRIIRDHLHDLERRNYEAMAEALDIEVEDAIEYHRMIRELEPWPGRGYADAEPRYITPDVTIVKMGGEWQIMLNEDGLPKLRVSPYYQRVLAGAGSKEDRQYIKGKLESADFLIKSIYKRQATILKVVRSILDRQRGFFELGIDHLKPMVLRDVAEDIDMHESTVSRVTSNKYLQCPQGIYELKFFFNAAIQRDRGADMASAAVKNRIRLMIAGEDPRRPLSDQGIAKKLREHGIRCARRTVAKYRESMGILPSSRRKRFF